MIGEFLVDSPARLVHEFPKGRLAAPDQKSNVDFANLLGQGPREVNLLQVGRKVRRDPDADRVDAVGVVLLPDTEPEAILVRQRPQIADREFDRRSQHECARHGSRYLDFQSGIGG